MFSREGVFTTIVYLVIAGGYAVEDALSNNTVRRDSCHVSRNFLIEAENLHFLARRGLSTPLRTLWRTRKRLPTWRSPFTTLRSCLFVFPLCRYCRTTKTMLCFNFVDVAGQSSPFCAWSSSFCFPSYRTGCTSMRRCDARTGIALLRFCWSHS